MSIEGLKYWIESFITKGKNFAIRNPVLANLIFMFLGGLVISICLQFPNASIVSANIFIAIATCSVMDNENYKSEYKDGSNKKIEHEVFKEDLDNLEAYEKSLPLVEELQKEVLQFIGEFSGVRKIM